MPRAFVAGSFCAPSEGAAMSAKKSDDEEFVGHALHPSQMKDFELPVPPPEDRPQTVWHLLAADEASQNKKTKQSPSGAAHAEQEK